MQESVALERGRRKIVLESSDAEEAEAGAMSLMPLQTAVARWIDQGQSAPIARWLEKELDADGVPRSLPVPSWLDALRLLLHAAQPPPDGTPHPLPALPH